jgi:DNA-binding beta-propeller fold protein YncE
MSEATLDNPLTKPDDTGHRIGNESALGVRTHILRREDIMPVTERSTSTGEPKFADATESHLVTAAAPSPRMSKMTTQFDRRRPKASALVAILATALVTLALPAWADEPRGFLETVKKHAILTSTVPDNGDQNPYAIIVAPVSAGKVQKDDVLVDNFNDISNLQGRGTTIIDYNPTTRQTTLFAALPRHLPQCPGGVGLTTAMTMLKSGWVIVGSAPSNDGTTRTKGDGCLMVLDANGQLVDTWVGPDINDPWGNMAVVDNGTSATLFVSMAGFDLPGPQVRDPASGYPIILHKATVLRIELTIPPGKSPAIRSKTVIGSGFSARADRGDFLLGPTGLAIAPDNTLYVSDALDNRVDAIADATTRTSSAGTGEEVTRDGLLAHPLALMLLPNGHLLSCNAWNGQVVEIDPIAHRQLYAQWIDSNQAQSPPGNGDLFGIAMRPDGKAFYYVTDDMNTVMETR